jgi:AraC family transcriptional regulator
MSLPYGQHLKTLEIDGLRITESLRAPQEKLARHDHPNTNINLVLHGSFVETVGTTATQCQAHDVVVRPGGEFHIDEYGNKGARALIIEVLPQRLRILDPFNCILNRAFHVSAAWLQPEIQRIYAEFKTQDAAAPLAVDALLLNVLCRLIRSKEDAPVSGAPLWLRMAKEYLHDQFQESLQLSDVAVAAGVHPAHLARAFRKHFHVSPGEYLRRIRLEFARNEILSSNHSIAEIASMAGFYDQSHFTTKFKKQFGIAPSAFRKFHTKKQ